MLGGHQLTRRRLASAALAAALLAASAASAGVLTFADVTSTLTLLKAGLGGVGAVTVSPDRAARRQRERLVGRRRGERYARHAVRRAVGITLAGLRPLPLALPVTVELRNGDGACWAQGWSAFVRRNDEHRFSGPGGLSTPCGRGCE